MVCCYTVHTGYIPTHDDIYSLANLLPDYRHVLRKFLIINGTQNPHEPPSEFWLALRSLILDYYKSGGLEIRQASEMSNVGEDEDDDPLNISFTRLQSTQVRRCGCLKCTSAALCAISSL